MQIKKRFELAVLTTAIALSLSGCGGSSTTDSINPMDTLTTSEQAYEITIERGPVLYAHVIDSSGIKATPVQDENGKPTNRYRFNLTPNYPISTSGGYIDLDTSGNLSAGDLKMGDLRLQTYNGSTLTIASTLADKQLDVLASLGFNYEQLTSKTPSTDLMIAALSDEVFAYALRNQITDLSQIDLNLIRDQIATRISLYQSSGLSAIEQEQNLINELAAESIVKPIDAITAETLIADGSLDITQQGFTEMTIVPETQELIAFSWNEEKMAKELYLNMYNDLLARGVEIKSLYNVATNSETKHQETMQNLAEKYDLDLITFANSDASSVIYGYDAVALAAVENAEFILPEVQSLYDGLWAHYQEGNATAISALEAACMVEVVDVNDLNTSIDEANALGAYELEAALESLRSGSYNHYWAFDGALIAQGIQQGCGILGAEYDQDYPQVTKGNGQGY